MTTYDAFINNLRREAESKHSTVSAAVEVAAGQAVASPSVCSGCQDATATVRHDPIFDPDELDTAGESLDGMKIPPPSTSKDDSPATVRELQDELVRLDRRARKHQAEMARLRSENAELKSRITRLLTANDELTDLTIRQGEELQEHGVFACEDCRRLIHGEPKGEALCEQCVELRNDAAEAQSDWDSMWRDRR